MTLEQFQIENYTLSDGEIMSIAIDYCKQAEAPHFAPTSARVELSISQALGYRKYRKCKAVLTLAGISEIRIFDQQELNGLYSDITITMLASGMVYLAFDPYGNSNIPNDEDNYVFIAQTIDIQEITP